MNLALISASLFILLYNVAAATKLTLEKRDDFDNRDNFEADVQLIVNDGIAQIPLNNRIEIYTLDPIVDIDSAIVLHAPSSFACLFSADGRLPTDPIYRYGRLRKPYTEAQRLICFITPDARRMLAIWVRYENKREEVLFLLLTTDGDGVVKFKKDFGRYVNAVKIVSKPRGAFVCRLKGEDKDLAFTQSDPLIGVTQLTMAISCSSPPSNPYLKLWGQL